MDPTVMVMTVVGVLGLLGRMRRGAEPSSAGGRLARSTASSAARPVQAAARQLPLVGSPAATVIGAIAVASGEAVGEVVDGASAAAEMVASWLNGAGRRA